MRSPFEPMFDVRDWWDPTGTSSGWYDQKFTDDVAGGDALASPTGVETLASVGSATATGTGTVTAVGVSSLAAIGTAAATATGVGLAGGVLTTAGVGTATATGTALASPADVASLASVGTAVASGSGLDATASPSGVEVSSAVGQAVADGGPADGLASPLGVEMVASVGTATAFDADLVVVRSSGAGSWRRAPHAEDQGELRVSVTVFPRGVRAEARAGRAIATGDAFIAVDGVSASTALGDVQAGADAVLEAAGALVGGLVGKAAAFDVHVLPVLRYTKFVPLETRSVDSCAGNPIAAVVPPAAPVGHPPPEAIDCAWSELQADEDELLLLGVIA